MLDVTLLSRADAEALAKRVPAFSTANEARVNIVSGWSGNTRFAGNEITTGGGTTDTTVSITSAFGTRSASAETNVLDDASLKRTVELSERLARLAPEDPEYLPMLGPQQYVGVEGYAAGTAELTPEARALAVQKVFDGTKAANEDLFVAGFLEASAGVRQAVATSKGLFAYFPGTTVDLSVTARTRDGTGSGFASSGAADWRALDPAALGRRAAEKGVASRQPVAIEPGQYTVVLEPLAVAGVLPLLMGSFSARSSEEGRSAFSAKGGGTKLGQKIADERVTLLSDPAHAELLAQPFDREGVPAARQLWIENGILKNLNYSRFWAQKRGVQPTAAGSGGFGGGGGGGGGAPGGGLMLMGGTKSTDELVAGVQRGVLVTRFWYIRFLDQRTVMLTGLTRDGTFLIENGKVTRSIKNLRWNESPLFMLNKLDELGRAERVSSGLVVPSLRVRDWNFTSLSDAV
jgi:predicted Zn-dependent protease